MKYHKSQRASLCLAVNKKKISINFLQDAGFALLFQGISIYKKMGKAFVKRDSHRLFRSGLRSYKIQVNRNHPTEWAGQHQALCRQGPPCRALCRIPAWLTGSPLPETAKWLLSSCSYLFWAKSKCSYKKPEQPNSSNQRHHQSLQDTGTPCCQQLTDIIKEEIIFYLPLDN